MPSSKTHTHDSTKKPDFLERLAFLSNWPSENAQVWVFDFARRACDCKRTMALVAIGSIVRPVPSVNDVDLLYIYEREPSDYRDHPLDVDVRLYPVSDIPGLLLKASDLLVWAINLGHLICQRESYWSDLCQGGQANPVLPSPEASLKLAHRANKLFRELLSIGDQDAAIEQLLSALTHQAWAELLRAQVLPASRSELPQQLRSVQNHRLAAELEKALSAQQTGVLPDTVAKAMNSTAASVDRKLSHDL